MILIQIKASHFCFKSHCKIPSLTSVENAVISISFRYKEKYFCCNQQSARNAVDRACFELETPFNIQQNKHLKLISA